jgi:hypothetical protein
MAKSFKGLASKNAAPKLSDFEKEMYETHESNEVHEVHERNEVHVLNDNHELVPFSTRITKGLYKKVRQYEYWERVRITEIVEQALTKYLEGKETAEKPLPEKELQRQKEISNKKKRKA